MASPPTEPNGAPSSSAAYSSSSSSTTTTTTTTTKSKSPPFLPTALEAAVLLAYPSMLAFGALFSLLSPTVRNAPYDKFLHAHSQDPAFSPSYFARKSNIFNVVFVKRGWAWISLAFFVFLFTHPATATTHKRARALLRWGLVTTWWVLVTQWCFGPAIIDRGFRFTGGRCEVVNAKIGTVVGGAGHVSGKDIFTAVACKTAGGSWQGGHDISGHVFLLVLGSYFLLQEVGWVYLNHWGRGSAGPVSIRDERQVVMQDGAVKNAAVEAERLADGVEHRVVSAWDALGLGGKFSGAVVALSWWMLLMTAIFFHTWFEKFTGLLVALTGLYTVYFLPRIVPALRQIVGLPGI